MLWGILLKTKDLGFVPSTLPSFHVQEHTKIQAGIFPDIHRIIISPKFSSLSLRIQMHPSEIYPSFHIHRKRGHNSYN